MAFDPKFPSAFYLPKSSAVDSFRFLIAEDGVGCNLEETSSLMQLIDIRDEHCDSLDSTGHVPMSSKQARMLSRNYRKTLLNCYKMWRERLALEEAPKTNDMETSKDTSKKMLQKEDISLSLLERTLGIVYLSEIYLLSPSLEGDAIIIDNRTAGIVTADTVRYLRSIHMQDPMESIRQYLPLSMSVDDLLAQTQPEYFLSSDNGRNVGTMPPFWILFRTLVLRGQLEDAWAVLAHHSAYRRCYQAYHGRHGTPTIHPTIAEEFEAFNMIHSILFTAPLPGGRNSSDDSGVALLQEDEATNHDMKQEYHFHGISSLACKLWDVDFDSEYNTMTDRWRDTRTSHHIPSQFNIHAAYNMYKSWRNSVSNLLKTNVPLKNLVGRIPLLKPCLWDIILVTRDFAFEPTDSWSEVLAHELIYIQPYIKKEDVHVRFAAAIQSRIDDSVDPSTRTYLDISQLIMEGNSAIVLESLHAYGGKSGAALPATQTALLCDLLMKTNQLLPSMQDLDLHTELFLNASTSILSSFASQHHYDLGIRLATQLLLPYAGPNNIRINARLSDILSHHYPKSDSETDGLISLCRRWAIQGSRRILDACESLTLCRAQYYERGGKLSESVTWLLKGIEIHREATKDLIEPKTHGFIIASSNFSKLQCLCLRVAENLMKLCLSNDHALENLVKQADGAVQAVLKNDLNDFIGSQPAFLILSGTVTVVRSFIDKKFSETAKGIVYCLDDRLDPHGAVITLAHPLNYGLFLALSYTILKTEETAASGFSNMTSSFDVHGVQILMMRFSQWQSLEDYGYQLDDRSKNTVSMDIQKALAKGLMRAFLAENAQLRKQPSSVPMIKFSGAVTAEEINYMLEPNLFT